MLSRMDEGMLQWIQAIRSASTGEVENRAIWWLAKLGDFEDILPIGATQDNNAEAAISGMNNRRINQEFEILRS
jgi:hypothetical protein